MLVLWSKSPSPHTYSHQPQDLLQRSEALQMLVDVQMEAEGWGREQRAGALAGLCVTSALSLMQVRRGRSAGGWRGREQRAWSRLDLR